MYSSLWETHHRATERHLPYGITQCYLLPDKVNAPRLNPSLGGWYLIHLAWKHGRLSWPRCWLYTETVYHPSSKPLDSDPTRRRNHELSIVNSTIPKHKTWLTGYLPVCYHTPSARLQHVSQAVPDNCSYLFTVSGSKPWVHWIHRSHQYYWWHE